MTPIVCLVWWRRLSAIDRSVSVRTDDILLLRQVPMLRPLPVPALEHLAHSLTRTGLAAGHVVFEAGDTGDSFYVVAEGSVEVVDHGRVVRTMTAGEGFGEIALLGDSTRTMTVRTVGTVQLCALTENRLRAGGHQHQRRPIGRGGHQDRLPVARRRRRRGRPRRPLASGTRFRPAPTGTKDLTPDLPSEDQ